MPDAGSTMNTTPGVRVRFAPSPTGKLHIGGARTAIFNWAFAKANGGTFVLRIDDTDPERSTEENEQVIVCAMRWLKLTWDEGIDVGGAYGPYRQAERFEVYCKAADELLKSGKAYRCFCTAEELDAARKAAQARKDSFQGYPRTCRDLSEDEIAAHIAKNDPYVVRLKVPNGRGEIVVHDLVHGTMRVDAREIDDFVLIRSDGSPTYNFCTVVDDALMKITHVIRGDDHISNTPKQVLIYEALGYDLPQFAHISMIMGEDGKKLSKRHGATSVEQYKEAGYDPDALVNYLALLGWSLDDKTTIIPRSVLAERFSLEHVSKNPATFDAKRLDWINKQYLSAMDDAEFARDVLVPALRDVGLEQAGPDEDLLHDMAWYEVLARICKPRCTVGKDAVNIVRFLYAKRPLVIDEKARGACLDGDEARVALVAAADALRELETVNIASIDEALKAVPERIGLTNKVFFGALRAALTGSTVSPPLPESIYLLGADEALGRLEDALDALDSPASA